MICGIIVAGLGVLNDVTITQASAVWELADESQSQRHLFGRAMRIGRDHIASTVYTIAFATAGASLSVLLLIAIYDRPLLAGPADRAVRRAGDRDADRLDRTGAGRAADHRASAWRWSGPAAAWRPRPRGPQPTRAPVATRDGQVDAGGEPRGRSGR